MSPSQTSNPKRRHAVADSNLRRFLSFFIVVQIVLMFFVSPRTRAAELHPEGFAGVVASRTDGEVGLSIEPGTAFGREEELWVYQKRDAIQIGGVIVKVNWARIGKVRVESSEHEAARALILEEFEDSSIAVGDEVGRVPNTPPRILEIAAEAAQVKPRHEISFLVRAVDDEGDPLTYSAEITGGTLLGASGDSPVMKWIAPANPGTYGIGITVSDNKGGDSGKTVVMEVPPVYEADPYVPMYPIGGNNRAHWQLAEVTDIEMDEGDNMWVLDGKSRLLRVSGPTGVEIGAIDLTFGKSALGFAPAKVCLARDDSLYVLDVSHKALQRIDRGGKRAVGVFDATDRNAFMLEAPSDIETALGDDVLVADSVGGHVTVIDGQGRFVLLFAAQGPGKGQLVSPISIATNGFGDIFVLDSSKGEIIEFDRSFRYRATYKCSLEGDTGEILADDRTGTVFVLDSEAGSVRKLDGEGELRSIIAPVSGEGASSPSSTSIALRSDGFILVGTENASIWEYDSSGTLRGILGEENFGNVPGIAVSDDGQLFVLDASVAQVNRFDRHRWLKGRFGARGKYEGQFVKPSRVCVDGEGNCYVFDDGANTIQKFYKTGVFAKALPIGADVAGHLKDAVDLDVNAAGDVHILDAKRKAVFIVTREGELKKIVPLTSSDARQSKDIKKPQDIAVDGDGFIYVSDPSAYAVHKFHPEGTRVNKFGGKGTDPGMFGKVADLAADGQGYVYVLLKDRNVVSKFNRDGRFIMEISLDIDEATPSKSPECIAVDSYGALYVFDNYYKAVFKFMQ
jgi:DNA-binding beta-propeller fold protein YncE